MESNDDVSRVRVGRGVSRRSVLRQIGAVAGLGAAGGAAGCSALMPGDEGPGAEQTDAETARQGTDDGESGEAPEYQLVGLHPPPNELAFTREPPAREVAMVTHNAQTSFFVPTVAGLHDATRQLGWSGTFSGPSNGFDVDRQVEILESEIDDEPDAIVTTLPDESAYDAVIRRALEEDVSVVLYNTNALTRAEMREKFGRALAYTGQDQLGAGYVCGLSMVERLPADADLVTVALSDPGHSGLAERADGMEEAIRRNSDAELTDRLNYTGNPEEGIARVENLIRSTDPDGIMGADAYTWVIGDALENRNASDEIVGGGFDLTGETLDHVWSGTLDYTIGQDPYSQGYVPVVKLFAYRERGMPPKDYPTGAEVVDEHNVDFARERSGAWGRLRDWQKEQ